MRNNLLISLPVLLTFVVITLSCAQNNSKKITPYNALLAKELERIYTDDQKYRQLLTSIEDKYGINSKEERDLFQKMNTQDSINLIKMTSFLDTYGWAGIDEVGEEGNSCIFLVIQHADAKTREKYLPVMQEAFKNGKALGSDLCYLTDRVATDQGKKQIYGTQLYRNASTGIYYFAPIADEYNVNKRRKEVGLGKLEDKANEFGFTYTLPFR